MHINIVTLFPEFFQGPLTSGLMQRAKDSGIISFSTHNPRDKTTDRHKTVDDRPYGGGPGMVMLPGPLYETLSGLGFKADKKENFMADADHPGRLLIMDPKGKPLTQSLARALAKEEKITLVCGRYEGIDQRIEELFPVEAVSVGDFVLNGGESAALCLMEAVGRLLPGFMGHEDSGEDESFSNGLLEYPQYTRPEEFNGLSVPEILRSGDHGRIAKWKRRESLRVTLQNRPELLSEADLDAKEIEYINELPLERVGKNLYCALVHHPVLDKAKKSVAVSLTNLDIHDIARSSCTYGLGGYYVITPIADQKNLLEDIVYHWTKGPGGQTNPDRAAALSLVKGFDDIKSAIADIEMKTGVAPLVVGTTARSKPKGAETIGFSKIAGLLEQQPVLLLFGTGHGLAREAAQMCNCFTPPVKPHGAYNHLSVRSAAAIIFDRILGDWK